MDHRALRTHTVAFDYNDDSILNSLSDIGVMATGFVLVRCLPVRVSIAMAVAIEVLPMLFTATGLS